MWRLIRIAVALMGGVLLQAPAFGANELRHSAMPDPQQLLTSEAIKKFIATQEALRVIELTRPRGKLRWAADDATVASLLKEDVEANQVFASVGWTALEYATTQSTIIRTLMAMDDIESGRGTRLPDDVSQDNVGFLNNLPDDVAMDFARTKRANIDEALRDLRRMRNGQ